MRSLPSSRFLLLALLPALLSCGCLNPDSLGNGQGDDAGATPEPDLAVRDLAATTADGPPMVDSSISDLAVPRADFTAAPPDCGNHLRDGDETDVDCGGATCSPCADGRGCQRGRDCGGGQCVNNVCTAPTCKDALVNQDESDIDCGGKTCSPCNGGRACLVNADCASAVCDLKRCVAPAQCRNGIKDGDETDIDCGGKVCGGCGNGRPCNAPADCLSGYCGGGLCGHPPTCNDNLINQDETDLDCGGAKCAPCNPPYQHCLLPRDCTSKVCRQNTCANPTCNDEVQNGKETDIDCAGGCGRCGTGQKCLADGDCYSGMCMNGACKALPGLSFALPVPYQVPGAVQSVAVGDFNGDQKLDLAIGEDLKGVDLMAGQGDGTFVAPVHQPVNGSITRLQAVDFNNDGKLDLIIHQSNVQLLVNLGGNFAAPMAIAPDAINTDNTGAVGDINNDKLPDLIIANRTSYSVRRFLNSNGTTATSALLPSPVGSPRNIALLDGDKDGKLDLVTVVGDKPNGAVGPSYSLLYYHGNGDGTFRAPDIFAPAKVTTAGGFAVADINGDGNQDVVMASDDMVAMNDELLTCLGKGDGTFGAPIHSPTGAVKGRSFYRLVTADFDQDGIPDVAGADPSAGVMVFRGKKDGSFQPGVSFRAGGSSIRVLATGDLNRDGKPDLISSDYFAAKVWVLLNNTP